MKRSLTTVTRGGLAVACATIVVACGTASNSDDTVTTTPDNTSAATTTTPPAVTAADPAQYQFAPDRYRFAVEGTPRRECVLFPGIADSGRTVTCSVSFPAGTPEVDVPPFGSGPPNAVALTKQGYYPTITESGPPGAAVLPVNSQLTVDDTTCTAISGGFECSADSNQVRYVDGNLTLTGTQTTTTAVPTTIPTTTPPTAYGAPMDVYTDSTTPAAPGTTCGASTGRRVLTVVSGTISCADALTVMDTYRGLPLDSAHGNANIREFDGWNCASPTYVMSRELGYGSRCSKGDIDLRTPVS